MTSMEHASKKTPRVYLKGTLAIGQQVAFEAGQTHYLCRVMRIGSKGGMARVFNERDGEFLARVSDLGEYVVPTQYLRAADVAKRRVGLAAPLVKPDKFMAMVDMATQLGVSAIYPVYTRYCQIDKINHQKTMARILEAAEQSTRCSIPTLHPVTTLGAFVQTYEGRLVFGALESQGRTLESVHGDCCALIGPEGGLTQQEEMMLVQHGATPLKLVDNVLRTEVAACVILTRLITG